MYGDGGDDISVNNRGESRRLRRVLFFAQIFALKIYIAESFTTLERYYSGLTIS